MKFGKLKSPQPKRPKGKGGGQAMLPNRQAVAALTKGDPSQQTIGNYAKLTPSGAGAPAGYGGIMQEAEAPGVADATPET